MVCWFATLSVACRLCLSAQKHEKSLPRIGCKKNGFVCLDYCFNQLRHPRVPGDAWRSRTQPNMVDAEAGDTLPGQVAAESESGAPEEIEGADLKADASHEEPGANKTIEDEAPAGEQLDDETPDAAGNEDADGLDVTKTDGGLGQDQDHGDIANGGGATAESGVEVADGGSVENENVYRRVRELALEAINAVRCCVPVVCSSETSAISSHA